MATAASSRYLAYLPAIFQQRTAAGQEPYLGHFLLPFEHAFQTFETVLSDLERYFTPALTAAEDFLPWLANWIALLVDEEWDEDQRRRLLSEAVALYRWRGTRHGLQRYLEIYTGLQPENIVIHEARWPQGMQIGVASRIGGFKNAPPILPLLATAVNLKPLAHRDYYVVDTIRSAGPSNGGGPSGSQDAKAWQVYCPTDQVQQLKIKDDRVEIVFNGKPTVAYQPATVHRRNALADNYYQLTLAENGRAALDYQGDPLLTEETQAPYRFMVEIQGASAQLPRLWLTQWLERLLAAAANGRKSTLAEAPLTQVLRHALTTKARMSLLNLQEQWVDSDAEQRYSQLTAILCEPLTEIERFVANWQLPTDVAIRTQLTAAQEQVAVWVDSASLPADLATRLGQLAAQVKPLRWACLTNEARKQLAFVVAQMEDLAVPPDDETRTKLQMLHKSVANLVSLPLTIQEALVRRQQQGQRKLHTILALEKPAHTAYALKATPIVRKAPLPVMAIGLHSQIGLNTTVG